LIDCAKSGEEVSYWCIERFSDFGELLRTQAGCPTLVFPELLESNAENLREAAFFHPELLSTQPNSGTHDAVARGHVL